jgi:drug/metabolite transporter (DMT)-like permease
MKIALKLEVIRKMKSPVLKKCPVKIKTDQSVALCGILRLCFFPPVDLIISKILYNRIPTLGPFQITFFRSGIVVALIAIYLNFRLKKEIYTKLKGLPIKPLIFRNLQSGSAAIVNTAVAGILSLTMIAVIKSLIPTFVVIIVWLALGEKLNIF